MAALTGNASGFMPLDQAFSKRVRLRNGQFLKGLLIGSDGESDSGKTEFGLSIPGALKVISIDRNFQGVLDNPSPPKHRNKTAQLRVVTPPMSGTARVPDYQAYHSQIRDCFYSVLDDALTSAVMVDGDSDWWELHVLAHFGKTTQIFPTTRYAAPYAERRAINCHAFDSGKIVLMTNKVKDEYRTVYMPDGTPKKDDRGEDMREKTGFKETQGFKDREYLYGVWLRHFFTPASTRTIAGKQVEVPKEWGVRITKCKHSIDLVGAELTGDQCNFRGMVDLIYPEVDPRRWGFDA